MTSSLDRNPPRLTALVLAVGLALALGCGPAPIEQPSPDAGSGLDAGSSDTGAGQDAGLARDAGAGDDAGPGSDAGVPVDAGTAPDAGSGSRVPVRLLAGNLTSGATQTYDTGEGIRIFQGLLPDIALIQEFNYGDNSPAALREFVDTAFGPEFEYHRESQATDTLPNGIVSRYPILQAGEWEYAGDRDLAWARIDVPGSGDLWAVSVHLLTASTSDRNRGARIAVERLSELMSPGDLLVFGGDLNTARRDEFCITVLADLFHIAAPYPADQDGNTNTSAPRSKPLDWLLVSPNLQARAVPVLIGDNSFADGLVFDSRVYTPLYDVEPVLEADSDALNMQHMALVRDFELFE